MESARSSSSHPASELPVLPRWEWIARFFREAAVLRVAPGYDDLLALALHTHDDYGTRCPRYGAEVAALAGAADPSKAGDLPPLAGPESERIEEAISHCFLNSAFGTTRLQPGGRPMAIVKCYRERFPMLTFDVQPVPDGSASRLRVRNRGS